MNISIRKLAMLEKRFEAQEEAARIEGFVSIPTDTEFKKQVTVLMDKIRAI